ncbi:ATP-binding protein [Sphingobium lactosutens]|uniref:sce7725 family protein n=1 Tax=Sphingobium lactosutens TaxID=522773 RepID=UPI0015BDA2BD|nr:sce7725 family protein [Sphingobium lactosutens]NWK97046.1 ATP-binding protein [Sphingobium lactosutens]
MYHPYFRGKQFELITIRETAALMAKANFVPIIEPVREALKGLERALTEICKVDGKAIVIVNPFHGDHAEDGVSISALLEKGFLDKGGITAGILLQNDMDTVDALACYEKHKAHNPTFIHAGFTEAKGLAEKLGGGLANTSHVFFEKHCHKLYRKHFKGAAKRVLLRDGFERRRNADHPAVELFSDLHVTYDEEDMDGFGDFLIVGDDYIEGGGPAYAVAIHLTFIDPEKDEVMYIYHFVSTTKDTPTDPAGKFAQALEKLIKKFNSGSSNLFESNAIKEFRDLHTKGHFPGLGYVKKLSMNHHIETLADFLV